MSGGFITSIKNQKYVLLSLVPKGQSGLAAENSELFIIPEDNIKSFTEEEQTALRNKPENLVKVDKLISSFDRSKMPVNGPDALLKEQKIWKWALHNGIKILGIEQNELPLVDFQISIKGGMLLDQPDKVGTSNLTARMMMQGTKTKTPLELEQAIQGLGANISISASNDEISIRANCLSSKFAETFSLVEEILFEPRWDEKEFERLKNEIVESIKRSKTSASTTASNVFALLIYSKDNILSNSTIGNEVSVPSITIQDLIKYYDLALDAQNISICIAGDVSKESAIDKFNSLEKN